MASPEPRDNLINIWSSSPSMESSTLLFAMTFFFKNLWVDVLASTAELALTFVIFKGNSMLMKRWLFHGSPLTQEVRYMRCMWTSTCH